MHDIADADDGNHYSPDGNILWQESWSLIWYDPLTRLGGFHHLGLQHTRDIADSWSWITEAGALVHKFQNNELPLPKGEFRDFRLPPFHLKTIRPLVEREVEIEHEGFQAKFHFTAFVKPFAFAMNGKNVEIGKSHYESCGRLKGVVHTPGRSVNIEAFCFQDHSWGPREYEKILSHRWAWACFGDDLFISAFHITGAEGSVSFGYIYDNGQMHELRKVDVKVEMDTDGISPVGCSLTVWSANGRGYRLKGKADGASMHTHRGGFMFADACMIWEMGGRIGTGVVEVNELKKPTNAIRELLRL